MERLLDANEVAGAVVYLGSAANTGITGQAITVNGRRVGIRRFSVGGDTIGHRPRSRPLRGYASSSWTVRTP